MSKPVFELLKKPKKKQTKTPTIPATSLPIEKIDLSPIQETLKKIQEQISQLDPVELTPIQEQLNIIQTQLTTLIDLMKVKVDLDAQEQELMDLLKQKLQKG